MKKPNLTHVLRQKWLWMLVLCAGAFLVPRDTNAQRCNNLGLSSIPSFICSDVGGSASFVDTISPFNAAHSWTSTNIVGSTTININAFTGRVTLSWAAPGDYVFSLNNTTVVCSDTFRVHVSSQFAPQAACNDTVNISLNEFCQAIVTPDLVLKGAYNYQEFEIIIKDQSTGLVIPTSPMVPASYKGKFLEVTARHRCSNNSCWGILRIEDKLDPTLLCKNYTVSCSANISPAALGFPLAPGAGTPVSSGTNTYTITSTLVDNCGATTLTYSDRTAHVNCPPPSTYIDTIFRSWLATDGVGRTARCVDTIYLRRAVLTEIICPPNWDGLPGNHAVIPCGASYPLDTKGNPHPSYTGYPGGISCRNLDFTYTDLRIRACEGTYKVLREWIIADWCTARDTKCIQIIKIVDDKSPVLTCATTKKVSTLSSSCEGEATVAFPSILSECNPNSITWQVKVVRGSPTCVAPPTNTTTNESTTGITIIKATGGARDSVKVTNLPVGCSWVKFYATDGCGNSSVCTADVEVQEKTKPIAVCDFETNVTLTDYGSAKVFAETFDDGSHDNCEISHFQVRRMNAGNCSSPIVSDTSFRDFVEFCCSDVLTNPNIVVFRVYDKSGNYNECMVQVNLVDKRPPVIVATLPDITVSCGTDTTNLNRFGVYRTSEAARQNIVVNDPGNPLYVQPRIWGKDGLVSEDCQLITGYSVSYSLNSCGVGTISRTFTFRDASSSVTPVTQTITFVNYSPFNGNQRITWPRDTILSGCKGSTLPDYTGKPSWSATNGCADVVATYEDQTFNVVEKVCLKILRKWTVIDWCNYNKVLNTGIWDTVQVIKVTNTVLPDFVTGCSYPVVDNPENDCDYFVNLTASATDDCTPAADLKWSYKIELFKNPANLITGNGNNASGVYPNGEHRITWTVEDLCGNKKSCPAIFRIRDAKKPTPVCRPGIITVIMPSSREVSVWARDFNVNSFDNCTPNYSLLYSFSPNKADSGRTFKCSDIPNGVSRDSVLTIYVWDLDNNSDYCTTQIVLQDGAGDACPDNFNGGGGSNNLTANLGGSVFNESSSMMENTDVNISNETHTMTKNAKTSHGQYTFLSLPMKDNYSVSAYKNDDPLNGVSTQDIVLIQKHILGIAELKSAYKVVAADVNNSESITARDISELRKLILGVTTNFVGNTSWRFINSQQQFADIMHPWPLQESFAYNNLDKDQMNNNFVAVKIGDLSGNARTNLFNGSQARREKWGLNIQDELVEAGKLISVPFMINSETRLSGLQMELQFDPEKVKFLEIENGTISLHDYNLNLNRLSEGVIRISFDQVDGFEADRALFNIKLEGLQSANLSSCLVLKTGSIAAEAYDMNSEAADLRLDFVRGDQLVKPGFFLFQNQPNPFSKSTTISFQLPEDGNAQLTIMDVNGRKLRTISKYFTQGYHTVELNKEELAYSGILYYQLEVNNFRAVRKMILID